MKKTSRMLFCVIALQLIAVVLPGQILDDSTPLKLESEVQNQELAELPNFWTSLVAMTFSLGSVLVMIGLVAWLAKKYLPVQKIGAAGKMPIEVIGSRNIGNKQSLMLVQVRGSTYLLGRSPQNITTLGCLSTAEASDFNNASQEISENRTGNSTSFARQLQSMTAK